MTARHSAANATRPAPRDPTPRDRKKAATWNKILTAARNVFRERGFAEATLDEVACRAGVAKGTLYRHVDSKADLYVEVLIQHGEEFAERMVAAVRDCDTATGKLLEIAESFIDYFSAHPEQSQIWWAVENQDVIGDLQPELLRKVSALYASHLSGLESVIREGVERGEFVPCDPWIMARVFWKMGDSYLTFRRSRQRDIIWPGERDTRSLYSEGLNLFLRGLARD